MRPRPTILGHLIDTGRISHTRVDEALAQGCPSIVAWCDLPATRFTRKQLREQLVQHLAAALRVGLRELACGTTGRFTLQLTPPRLVFAWTAHLDLLTDGACAHTIKIECIATMARSTGELRRDEATGTLQIQGEIPWLCATELTLREPATDIPALFHSEQGQVSLAATILNGTEPRC